MTSCVLCAFVLAIIGVCSASSNGVLPDDTIPRMLRGMRAQETSTPNGLFCVTSGQGTDLTDKLYPHADCTESYVTVGTNITLKGTQAPRMYITEGEKLLTVNTKEESISWTMNVAKLGGLWNGALYMTYVNFTDPTDAMWYCDANAASNGADNNLFCFEMDLAEANTCGFRSTSHGCVAGDAPWPRYDSSIDVTLPSYAASGPSGVNSICYGWGSAASFGGVQDSNPIIDATSGQGVPFGMAYGSGSHYAINTEFNFDVNVSFAWNGDVLEGWTQTLSQGGKSVSTTQYTNKEFTFQESGQFALLVQLWENDGLPSWLSGDCVSGRNPPSISYDEVEAYFYNVTIMNKKSQMQRVLAFSEPFR